VALVAGNDYYIKDHCLQVYFIFILLFRLFSVIVAGQISQNSPPIPTKYRNECGQNQKTQKIGLPPLL
jgi:hypothetical protein